MTIKQMMTALQAQVQEELCGTANPVIEQLQVTDYMNSNPTPPSIDIYPGTPFTEAIAYGRGQRQYWFTVRARVTTVDEVAGQDLLLAMMDDGEPESVEAAIRSASTYAGAKLGNVEGPTEYIAYTDTGGPGDLLGTSWRVALIP